MPLTLRPLLFAALPLALYAGLSLCSTAQAATQPVQVRDLRIGEGRPKIIVSTSGKTAEQVLEQGRTAAASPAVDLLELRLDLLAFATDADQVAALGRQLVQTLGGKPLLLTFRSRREGGAGELDDAAYAALYGKLLQAGFADLIDVEMRRDERRVKALVVEAHKTGAKVILSSHDFQGTPGNAELLKRLQRQQTLGADILKLAVMPHDGGDVARLLQVTWTQHQRSPKPLLIMAMGGVGAVSRLAGETFGSALTFGSQGQASAPGQIEADVLQQTLEALHRARQSSS